MKIYAFHIHGKRFYSFTRRLDSCPNINNHADILQIEIVFTAEALTHTNGTLENGRKHFDNKILTILNNNNAVVYNNDRGSKEHTP